MNIMVLGCSGGGKSTLTRKLAEIMGLRPVHMDLLFWKANWVQRDQAEIMELVSNELKLDDWVFDGNHSTSHALRVEKADMIIWVDIARWRCLFNVCFRVAKYWGKTRPSMTEGCAEKVDLEFLTYIWNFRHNMGVKIEALIEQVKDLKTTYHLKSYVEIDAFVEKMARENDFQQKI